MSEEAALALMEARLALKPLRQGQVDGFCGVYAVLNAVRLLAYPDRQLHPAESRRIFRKAVHILSRHRLLKMAATLGLDPKPWQTMLDNLMPEIESIAGFPIRQRQVFEAKAGLKASTAIAAIRNCIDQGCPIVLILDGVYDHWTVIAGYSHHRLHLFDSDGYRWINPASVGLDDRLPHFLRAESTFAFERVSGG